MKPKTYVFMAAALLVTSTLVGAASNASASSIKGQSCPVLGAKLTTGGYTYTCTSVTVTVNKKKVKKLEYGAGVKVPPTTTTTTAKTISLPSGNFDTTPGGSLIFQENFEGAAGSSVNSAIWTPVTGAGQYGTGEIENNTSSAANLQEDGSGNLVITAQCVATTSPGCESSAQSMGSTWTSARIWTENKATFEYGQLEARIWMPTGSFNWPAFWMMGESYGAATNQTSWPLCGELDIAEGLQGNTQDQATIHSNIPGTTTDWGEGSGLTQVAPLTGSSMTSGWHTYGILWQPNSIAFILDGKVWAEDVYNPTTTDVTQTELTSTGATVSTTYGPGTAISSEGGNWPFNAPFFIILNDAVGGVSSPIAPNGSSGTMKINWIKYYKYNGYGSTNATSANS
jgi:beta-glucanase (GH16 family)